MHSQLPGGSVNRFFEDLINTFKNICCQFFTKLLLVKASIKAEFNWWFHTQTHQLSKLNKYWAELSGLAFANWFGVEHPHLSKDYTEISHYNDYGSDKLSLAEFNNISSQPPT